MLYIKCEICGHPVNPKTDQCTNCDAVYEKPDLNSNHVEPEPNPHNTSSPNAVWLGRFLAWVIFIIGVITAFTAINDNPTIAIASLISAAVFAVILTLLTHAVDYLRQIAQNGRGQ